MSNTKELVTRLEEINLRLQTDHTKTKTEALLVLIANILVAILAQLERNDPS